MVLKEMVRSTKSLARAKDTDILKYKKRLQKVSGQFVEDPQFYSRRKNTAFSIKTTKKGPRPQSILRNSMRRKHQRVEDNLEDQRSKFMMDHSEHQESYIDEQPIIYDYSQTGPANVSRQYDLLGR